MRNAWVKFCAVLVLGFTTSSLWAAEALADFLARLDKLQNLQAHFVQTTRDARGISLQELQGTLTVAKPGKMHWQTQPPYEQLVVSDGDNIWVYDMDLEQVTIRKMEQRIVETPALLLSGNSQEIRKNFNVEMKSQVGKVRFMLTPNDKSQLFERIELQYADTLLQSMRIIDAAGQTTDIVFDGVKTNQKVSSNLFTFIVPEGVDVIDGRHAR